jgi:hypothetical protein
MSEEKNGEVTNAGVKVLGAAVPMLGGNGLLAALCLLFAYELMQMLGPRLDMIAEKLSKANETLTKIESKITSRDNCKGELICLDSTGQVTEIVRPPDTEQKNQKH